MSGEAAITLDSISVDQTLAIGRAIGGALVPGDVLALVGPLGTGKTHLTKGLAVGLGAADDRVVNSPTFVLVNEYDGRLPIRHLDAYRLPDADALLAMGFDEMCDGSSVVILEWADRVAEAIGEGAVWIELGVTGDSSRRLSVRSGSTEVAERLGAALAQFVALGNE